MCYKKEQYRSAMRKIAKKAKALQEERTELEEIVASRGGKCTFFIRDELNEVYRKLNSLAKDYTEYKELYLEEIAKEKKIKIEPLWAHYESTLEETHEVKRKYETCIMNIEDKVGNIIDVSNVRLNEDGKLEGYVVGEKGKIFLETIEVSSTKRTPYKKVLLRKEGK